MTEIQQNRWDRLVRRAANVVGGGSQVNDTLNELFPVLDVENVPGELLALMQTDLGFCSAALAGVAAQRNHHQLFNPVGSNALIVVTTVTFQSTGTAVVMFRFSNFIGALGTLAGNERRRDTRAGTLASIVAQQRTATDITNGGLDYRVQGIGSGSTTLTDPNGIAVLFPGTGLTISAEETNTGTTVSFMWRERVFEPAELVT